jgi:hypothetical protein
VVIGPAEKRSNEKEALPPLQIKSGDELNMRAFSDFLGSMLHLRLETGEN